MLEINEIRKTGCSDVRMTRKKGASFLESLSVLKKYNFRSDQRQTTSNLSYLKILLIHTIKMYFMINQMIFLV